MLEKQWFYKVVLWWLQKKVSSLQYHIGKMYGGEGDYQKIESEEYEYASYNSIDYRNYIIGHETFQFRSYGTFYDVHEKHGQQNTDEKCYLLATFIITHCNVYWYKPENPHSGIGYIEDKAFENIL